MAWESHGRTKRYYYRQFRQAGRVQRRYCGSGNRGALAAEVDLLLRLEVQEQKEAFAKLTREAQAIAGLLTEMALILDAWLKQELLTHGWTFQEFQWKEPSPAP